MEKSAMLLQHNRPGAIVSAKRFRAQPQPARPGAVRYRPARPCVVRGSGHRLHHGRQFRIRGPACDYKRTAVGGGR